MSAQGSSFGHFTEPTIMPNISTTRLILRPLLKAPQRQVAWLRDPDVTKFSEQRHKEHTVSSQLRFITGHRGPLWGIHLATSDVHIGNIGAEHDVPNSIADIGILIGEKAYWGHGYGLEAWKAVCDFMLDKNQGAVRKLEAGCMKSNEAMLRIIRKTRFVQEGERVSHFDCNGTFISMMLFG